jgi:hypothetical protein
MFNNSLQGDVLRYVESITNRTNNTDGVSGAYSRYIRKDQNFIILDIQDDL